MSGLCFPNGLALSADESKLFIAETGEYRIWKVDAAAQALDSRALAGDPLNPQATVILADLPGFPDNLARGEDGRLWVGLSKPRSAVIDDMSNHPQLRAISLRLPRALLPVPRAYGHVIAFDEDGRVLVDLQDPAGRIPETSGATLHDGRLYVHSLHGDAFGVLSEPFTSP
jgi:sugar lactone lactonase YvrE